MDNNDDNLNPMPTEAPVETPTETPAPEAPIDIETTDEPAPADAPVEAPAEETPAEPEAPAEETPVEETPAEPEAPAEAPAEEAPAEAPIEESAPIEPSIPVETPAEPTEPVIESAPIDMTAPVAPVETPKKKSKAGLIIAAIALIVILSGAIIAMLIISNNSTAPTRSGNNSSNNSGNNSSNSSQVVEEEDTEEVAVKPGSDADQKIDKIMHYILAKPGNGTLSPVDIVYSNAAKYFGNGDLSSAKLYNIVHYMTQVTRAEEEAGATTFTYAKKLDPKDYPASEDLSKYYGGFSTREEFLSATLQFSAEDVEELYYQAFGEEPKHESTGGCDTLYDSKHKVYYYGPLSGCGGAAINELLFTPISKSKLNSTYFADYYVALGIGTFSESYSLYAGATEETGVVRAFNNYTAFEECRAIVIDENSCLTKEEKAKIKTYRFVFDKDGDDLHFKEVIEKK